MAEFKPMVKMETTEPSVELKLKKGGHVNMKKGGKAESGHKKMAMGGAMDDLASTPAFVGRPAVNAPVKVPGKPSMASRRKAMMPKAKPTMTPPMTPPMNPPAMKKGGSADMAQDKAMIKKAIKQHDAQEHKGGKGTKLTLKKGGKATGGVAMSNAGGYKAGGEIDSKKPHTKMVTTKKMATGGVALSNAGGYATGGVAMSNAGGFKKGGSTKKGYAAGGKVDSGRPVAMPQGQKKPPAPATQVNLSGVYKKGGKVAKKAYGGSMAAPRTSGYAPAQTIKTAPIGTSIADRDFFASRGKRFKDGGNVQKKALGGPMGSSPMRYAPPPREIRYVDPKPVMPPPPVRPTQPIPRQLIDPVRPNQPKMEYFNNQPKPLPKIDPQVLAALQGSGGVIKRNMDAAFANPSPALGPVDPMDPRMQRQPMPMNASGPVVAYKRGGNVSSKSLQKAYKSENAPEMRDSKKDDNLGYVGGNATKTPKFK